MGSKPGGKTMGRTSTSITVLLLGLLLSGTVPATEQEDERARGMEMMMKPDDKKTDGHERHHPSQ
jgi:hypothetical protein